MNFKKLTIPKKATMYIILGSIVLSLIAMFFANNMIKNKAKREVIQVIKNQSITQCAVSSKIKSKTFWKTGCHLGES